MISVIFEVHGLTNDNENRISSGFADVELSEKGMRLCKDLGERYKDDQFAAIFSSDLQRSYKTAELAFGNRFPIIKDARLREVDYGDLTRHSADEVEAERAKCIYKPFPNGESYKQAVDRIGAFLIDLKRGYSGMRILIIGHGATWRSLEYWLADVPLEKAITVDHNWQPGWQYELK